MGSGSKINEDYCYCGVCVYNEVRYFVVLVFGQSVKVVVMIF